MPAAILRSLKTFKSQQQRVNFLQSCKAGLHHVINSLPVACQHFAVSQVEPEQHNVPGTKVRFSLAGFSLPPPTQPYGTTLRTCLADRLIAFTEFPSIFTMEERKGEVSVQENLNGDGDANSKSEEMVKLEEEKEEKKKEMERFRIKEIEDKIGPPPDKPLAGDCCGQGCEVCIWDTYWEELDRYKKLRKEAEEDSSR